MEKECTHYHVLNECTKMFLFLLCAKEKHRSCLGVAITGCSCCSSSLARRLTRFLLCLATGAARVPPPLLRGALHALVGALPLALLGAYPRSILIFFIAHFIRFAPLPRRVLTFYLTQKCGAEKGRLVKLIS